MSRAYTAGVMRVFACALVFGLAGCAGTANVPAPATSTGASASASTDDAGSQTAQAEQETVRDADEKEAVTMKLSIGGNDVDVEWEDNQAVSDLQVLAAEGPLTIALSRYGGFEQVGPLGATLTSEDKRITTAPGDIVLYADDQISVFYGANTWAYTKLGHVVDKSADEMEDLLAHEDVSIMIGF